MFHNFEFNSCLLIFLIVQFIEYIYFLKSIFILVISPTKSLPYFDFRANFSTYSSKASTQSIFLNPNGLSKFEYVPAPAPISKIFIDDDILGSEAELLEVRKRGIMFGRKK